ncbi:TPA: conjugal transfer protein TraF [Enterococcus faecalis]
MFAIQLKKVKIVSSVVISLFVLSSCTGEGGENKKSVKVSKENVEAVEVSKDKEEEEFSIYDDTVSKFSRVTAKGLLENNDNKRRFVYFGRRTCPYCRKFAPLLGQLAQKNKLQIEYLDTEDTQIDKDIQNVREKYNVETVPTLIYFNTRGEVQKYDSETKEALPKWLEEKN